MSGIRAGNIYYTVGIDKASLAALKKEVKAIGDTAKSSSQGLASINPALAKLAAQSTDVSNRMRTLNKDFQGNRRESQQYRDGMRALGVEAGRLRDEVSALGPGIINSDRAMALASGTTAKLSGVMTQAAKVTGHMGDSSQMLGSEVAELMRSIDAINTEIRTLADELSVGAITTNQFSAAMKKQEGDLDSARVAFNRMNTAVEKTDGSSKQLRDTQRKLSITTRLMANENSKATGKINQMAMAQKLSYGATTLLNDRIFQMSPALGILTNQLIFTTNGLKAFLRAALPIVAVAGGIIAAISSIVISIKSGIGLEQALADVRKTTNLANEELRGLTNTFQDVARRLPSTTLELLEIARVAGQLGITGAANIEKFTVAVAELSIATDVVGEEGATSLARFLQATGTATDQLGSIAAQVGNILNELENTTAATASEILQMTSYTQGLASQAGATRPEILGLNAALLSLGVKAEAGGSAVVRTISKIQVAAVEGETSLKRFADVAGLSVDEFQRIVDDSPVEALLALARGMRNSADEGANLNQVLIDLGINEVRERRALLALAQGAETFAEAMETANTEALQMLSLQNEVEIMSGTVGARLKMLKSRFTTLGQELSQHTLPIFSDLVDILITSVDGLTFFVENVNLGITRLRELAGVPADVSKELGILNRAFDKTRADIDTVRGAIVDMSEATGKNGLIGVLQDFAATLDTDARGALARFVEATVEPLLSQGKLQEAISETIGWFVRMGAAAAKESLGAMTSLYNLTYARLEQASAEYNALLEMRQKLLEGPQSQGVKNAINDITLRLIEIDTGQDGLAVLREQFNREGLAVVRLQEEVEFYENAVRELSEMTSVEEMRAWIAENFGSGRRSALDGGDSDAPDSATAKDNPVKKILDAYTQEVNFLRYFLEDQGGEVVNDLREFNAKALDAAQGAKEALVRLLSDPNLDSSLVSSIMDGIEQMDRAIENLFEGDPTEAARVWIDRLTKEFQTGNKTGGEIVQLIAPVIHRLEQELAALAAAGKTGSYEFGILSDQLGLAKDLMGQIPIDELENVTAGTERWGDGVRATLSFIEQGVEGGFRDFEHAILSIGRTGMQLTVPMIELLRERFEEAEEAAEDNAKAIEMARQAHIAYADRVEDAYPSTAAFWDKVKEGRAAAENLATGISVLDMQLRVGLIDSMEHANGKIKLQEQYISALSRVWGPLSPKVIEATEALAGMNEELRVANELSQALAASARAIGAAMDRRAGRGFTADDESAQADWGNGATPAIQAVQREVDLLTRYLSSGEGPGPMLLAAFRELQALAPSVASGFSELAKELLANELAAKLVVRNMADLRNEEDELQAMWGGERPAPKPEPEEKETTISSGRGELTRIGFDLSFAENLKATFLGLAESSDVVSAALGSFAMETDDTGKVIGMSFDPMMMLVQIIGKVLSRSEGLATALETLDKVLDPLVDIVDALFGALQPIIEVAVALVQGALRPVVWIIESILAPALSALASIVQTVWNALARIVPWLERVGDSGHSWGEENPNPPGSVASIEWELSKVREEYRNAATQAEREMWARYIQMYEQRLEDMDALSEDTSVPRGSLGNLRLQLASLRDRYEKATSDEERRRLLMAIESLEEEIKNMEAIARGEDPEGQVTAGTNISEITGPTRDLLIDLLRPLSILPSWTSMIQDIRNDVRSIAMTSYGMPTPVPSTYPLHQGVAAGAGTNYTFNNVTITTNASSVQKLVRDISKYTFKERRGGK